MKYNSTKESGEMSLLEARFIQYSKLILALLGIIVFSYWIFNKCKRVEYRNVKK